MKHECMVLQHIYKQCLALSQALGHTFTPVLKAGIVQTATQQHQQLLLTIVHGLLFVADGPLLLSHVYLWILSKGNMVSACSLEQE